MLPPRGSGSLENLLVGTYAYGSQGSGYIDEEGLIEVTQESVASLQPFGHGTIEL